MAAVLPSTNEKQQKEEYVKVFTAHDNFKPNLFSSLLATQQLNGKPIGSYLLFKEQPANTFRMIYKCGIKDHEVENDIVEMESSGFNLKRPDSAIGSYTKAPYNFQSVQDMLYYITTYVQFPISSNPRDFPSQPTMRASQTIQKFNKDPHIKAIEEHPKFKSKMTGEEAQIFLGNKPANEFLIRPAKIGGRYSISFKTKTQVLHAHLVIEENGKKIKIIHNADNPSSKTKELKSIKELTEPEIIKYFTELEAEFAVAASASSTATAASTTAIINTAVKASLPQFSTHQKAAASLPKPTPGLDAANTATTAPNPADTL